MGLPRPWIPRRALLLTSSAGRQGVTPDDHRPLLLVDPPVNSIDHVVNTSLSSSRLNGAAALVKLYAVVIALTVVVMAVLTAANSAAATPEAWVHVIIVAMFAVVLALRMRAARRGDPRARKAVVIISAVLALANLVTAAIPGLFPSWMRIEMVAIAVLMVAVVGLVLHAGPPTAGTHERRSL